MAAADVPPAPAAGSPSPAESESGARPRRSKKAEAQRRGRSRTPRLSYDDWVDGALALLAREGVAAIKIPRLCSELGVTKGSFYWHFDDLQQLMEAMADRWSAVQSDAVRALGAIDSIPVEQRIENMATLLVDQSTWIVEATVREWARTDPKVAGAVQALERKVFDIVNQTMLELGFDETQSRLRAGAMVYLGIGLIHGRDSLPTPTAEEAQAVIDLLTTPSQPRRPRT
ncbi:AcrR family transcriptional regulator [Nocardia transvalensis]|uniref:AcrR family transcriptional regulator n=1 Tax=Nocardia transvalensis TaxID=37333 RepID=A0A7W9PKH3_9NOCA|nr:TetR/AcrR family transcriptional regulator [Nocardia transvalensis]MBB5917810.1 AcrR family transcriptional regulator [Nocardia transvalensis]